MHTKQMLGSQEVKLNYFPTFMCEQLCAITVQIPPWILYVIFGHRLVNLIEERQADTSDTSWRSCPIVPSPEAEYFISLYDRTMQTS